MITREIIDISEQADILSVVPKTRAGSAPPVFDSSSLFLYMEDDVYTRSFTKGPSARRETFNGTFAEHCKQKTANNEETQSNGQKQLAKEMVRSA